MYLHSADIWFNKDIPKMLLATQPQDVGYPFN